MNTNNIIVESCDEFIDTLSYFNNIIKILTTDNINFYIAGGCFKSIFSRQKVNDIDIFFNNETSLSKAISLFENHEDYVNGFNDQFVYNFYHKKNHTKIQLIKKYLYNSISECIDSFDFSVCKFAYDGKNVAYSYRFFRDLAKKVLIFDGKIIKPLSTYMRVLKYLKQDFTICNVGMLTLAKEINNLEIDWNNPDHNVIQFYPNNTPKFMGID